MVSTSLPPGFPSLTLLLSLMIVGCAARPAPRVRPPYCAIGGPAIIAHRGGALEAPENTAEAVRHGVRAGAEWQEIDVMLTADGQVVLFHDDLLDRTTSGTGPFADKTLTELEKLTAGRPAPNAWTRERMKRVGVEPVDFGDLFADARIPTLAEVLDIPGARLMIELKKGPWHTRLAEQVVRLIAKKRVHDRVAIASFDKDLLWAAYDADPTIPLVGIAGDTEQLAAMLDLPVGVVAVAAEIAGETLAAAPAGVAVWCWTVYEVQTAKRLAQLGVHGLITDVPQVLVTELRAPPDLMMKVGE